MARPLSGESTFRALAHATRRNIVLALRNGERAVSDLLPAKDLASPTISNHLRALQNAGLVTFRRRGTSLMYRLNHAALRPIEQFLEKVKSNERDA